MSLIVNLSSLSNLDSKTSTKQNVNVVICFNGFKKFKICKINLELKQFSSMLLFENEVFYNEVFLLYYNFNYFKDFYLGIY